VRLTPCEVPVTVRVYVPDGVQLGRAGVLLPPPPHPDTVIKTARHTMRAEAGTHARTSFVRHRPRPLRAAIKTQSNTVMVCGSGSRGARCHGRRIRLGGKSPRAAVVTVTLNVADDAPEMFTEEGEVLQVDWAGAPLQVRLTAPVNPEIGFT